MIIFSFMEWSPKMAKKPMTKAQIVSHFAKKFELTRKTASGILDEVAALAVSEIGARRG
jgi:nucleoid DNA-binding protein